MDGWIERYGEQEIIRKRDKMGKITLKKKRDK